MIKQARFFVSGRVQGVFYRATARSTANRLDLKGWIKNLTDGTVEGVVVGEESKIREFIDWAKEGSSAAKVEQIEVEWKDEIESFDDFSIRRY